MIAAETHTWFGSTTFGLAQGFRRLGWEVSEIGQASFTSLDRSIISRAISRLTRPMAVAQYNQQIVGTAERMDANLLLTVKGNYIKPETLVELRRRKLPTINYYPDFRFSYPSVDPATFPLYSMFVTTKSFQVAHLESQLGRERVRFLHHGYCPDVFYPPERNVIDATQAPDVLYIGTYTAHKERLFAQVLRSLPQLKFRLYGHGWDGVEGALKSCVAGRPLLGINYAQLANAAGINLAIHMGPVDESGWEDLVSTRSFELPSCKAFMLHVDNPEIRTLYTVGEEIDVFRDAEDLSQKIAYYLVRPELRRQMAEKAWRRCVPAYSYDARARQILEWVNELGG